MTFCERCNGIGYLWIQGGDSDHICPECCGTGNVSKPPMNIQDIYRIGEILCRKRFSSVVDIEGKHVSHVSVDLRTGNFSILRTWHVDGFMKRDVIVVQRDYVILVTEKETGRTKVQE